MIINESFHKGVFPSHLKLALVTPIYKKGDKSEPSNYRPISSLPILSKIFESTIKDQITCFLEKEHLISDRQFGFRKHHSSEQLLQSLLNDWHTSLDNKSPLYITAMSLDIQKAFDSVNHKILISKLSRFHLSPTAIKLISSYLSNRKQAMKIGNCISVPLPITCGVPQGSILGPLLFLLMTNDFLASFPSSFAYADDTLIFSKVSNLENSLSASEALLQQALTWYQHNLFQLNISKTEFCIFSNRKVDSTYFLTVNNTKIKSNDTLMVFGVLLDTKLSFTPHVNSLCRKASSLIYLFSKFRHYLNIEQARLAYTSIVRPALEYCSSLILNTSQSNRLSLERIQNRAIRIIMSAPFNFSVTTGRRLLNLPTLTSRRNYLFYNFIHKKLMEKKVSNFILKILASTQSHHKFLRRQNTLIKPSFRTNFGKSTLPSLLHTYISKKINSAESLLLFE